MACQSCSALFMRRPVYNVKTIHDSFHVGNMPLTWCTGRVASRERLLPLLDCTCIKKEVCHIRKI